MKIAYQNEEMVLEVDEQSSRMVLLRNNHFLKSYVDAPLFIGGLPGKPMSHIASASDVYYFHRYISLNR